MVQDDSYMDFGELFESSARQPGDRALFPGETVKGKVVLITADTVFIDYGAKSEGWAEREEFLNDKGEITIQPGSDVELSFIGYGPSGAHLGSCLRKTSKGSGSEMLETAYESGITIEGTITGTNKGGLEVTISGTTVFCPFSQIDLTYCDHPELYIGTTQKFQVIQYEEEGRNIIVSRKVVLQAERQVQAAKTREGLSVGEKFPGRVTRLTPFGAFVDLGGIEGLLHVSEISRTQVKDPADYLSLDQEVIVQVLNLEKDEKGNERISLSLKALEPDPWETGFEFFEGDTVQGRVRNLTAYGAFVEVAPGVEGLVHISEISHKHIHHPKEKLQEGQELEVKILEINKEQHRISLSIKDVPALLDSAPDALSQKTIRTGNVIRRRTESISAGLSSGLDSENLPAEPAQLTDLSSKTVSSPQLPRVGLTTKGIIRTAKPYGFFVDLPELGSHQSGLLHISQVTSSGSGQSKKGLKEGDEIQVEIIKIDEQGRISLSQISILENQDRADYNDYQDQVKETGKLGTMAELFKKFKG
ncbi:MAG: 30S ribosomal protein S1 [Desulfobacca sp.]|nr:30S ribosomal protein S1 [Desulfobacca sp.]